MATSKGASAKAKRIKSMSIDIVRTVDGAVIFFIDGAKATPAAVRKAIDSALPAKRKPAKKKPAPAPMLAD